MVGFLVLAAIVFVAYALWTQYGSTSTADSQAKRVVTAIGFALAAVGSAVMAFFHSGTPTP